jgi:hypothetical protein
MSTCKNGFPNNVWECKNEKSISHSNIALHWDLWLNYGPLKAPTQVQGYKTLKKNH